MGQVDGTSRVLLPALAEYPGHLLWRASARVTAALATALPPGVDLHAYAALLGLAGAVSRSQQELADTLLLSRTTMVRVAGDLVAQGLVDRVRNPHDRRSYALTRTAEGAAAARRWRRFADDLEQAITAGFSLAERADLGRLLLALVQADLRADVPDELRSSTSFLVTRVHARMHRDFLAALEPLDIEPRDFGALRALTELGPVAQAELARALGVSGPTIVEMADRLEARGLVERRRSPTDRRTQLLHLLPAAERVLDRAAGAVRDCDATTLGPLDRAERHRLLALLQRFVTAP